MASQISGVNTPSSTVPSTLTGKGNSNLGEASFLKLLTAQLQNQDPLQPTDNAQFVAELAQFSSLEAATATNTKLDSLIAAQFSNNQTATAQFIGKDVIYNSSAVGLTASGAKILATLSNPATTMTMTLTDSTGKVVRTITANDVAAGAQSFAWDGKDQSGKALAAGTYTVAFDAKDAAGNSVTVTTQGRARVTGVTYQNGSPALMANGLSLKLSDVVQVLDPSTSTSSTP